jgi:hypothetical protein
MQAQIWAALNRALKSMIHNESQTPPSILPLMEGGGPRLVLKSKQRSTVRNPMRRSTDHGDFQTLLGILSLIKGGGGPGMNLPHIGAPVTCVVALLVHESHPPHAD